MRKLALIASVAAALLMALPGVAAADPAKNVLPVELTCAGETFDLVSPAGGRAFSALFAGSTSVAILVGVNGDFIRGFNEANTTTCTAVLPDGTSFTAHTIITPRR
jgi:hypothetical protein